MDSTLARPDPRELVQGQLSKKRILELALDPVEGIFDAAHLKEINRRIFQDFPKHGFDDVTPGQFRPPIEGFGAAYVKGRRLESVEGVFPVAYSKMDDQAQGKLAQILERAKPDKLALLDKPSFVKEMATIYASLDYAHPFPEGNSRTLREFTRTLAKKSGYTLAWEKIGVTSIDHDRLYIARDRAVYPLAVDHVSDRTLVAISSSVQRLKGNPDLDVLLDNAIRPTRAIAFENKSEVDAIQQCPELKTVYDILKTLEATGRAQGTITDGNVDSFSAKLHSNMVASLDTGKLPITPDREFTLPERNGPGRER
jgi:cell filamentation protein